MSYRDEVSNTMLALAAFSSYLYPSPQAARNTGGLGLARLSELHARRVARPGDYRVMNACMAHDTNQGLAPENGGF